jgi:hypothetical protein
MLTNIVRQIAVLDGQCIAEESRAINCPQVLKT